RCRDDHQRCPVEVEARPGVSGRRPEGDRDSPVTSPWVHARAGSHASTQQGRRQGDRRDAAGLLGVEARRCVVNRWDAAHACTGKSLLRMGLPDLADDLELWRSVWTGARAELLDYWIKSGHAGSRPEAWWRWSADGVATLPGESEVECLYRNH